MEMGRIARENRAMLKRLEDVEPMYKVTEWIDDWQRKEELTEMITAYPESVRGTDDFVRVRSDCLIWWLVHTLTYTCI